MDNMDNQQLSISEKLLKIIESSTLNPEDKKQLSDTIELMPQEQQLVLFTLLEEDPNTLDLIMKNFKMKLEAVDNPDKIQKIIDAENEDFNRALISESQ